MFDGKVSACAGKKCGAQSLFDDPLDSALKAFASERWTPPAKIDRDSVGLRAACARGQSRLTSVPEVMRSNEAWGGGLRRLANASDRFDASDASGPPYRDPRYVPIGFARYVSPVLNPADYAFYRIAAWRVAVVRTMCSPQVRAILNRIVQYGPQSAGYVRIGDTLVPSVLTPGDRQTLAQTEARDGPSSRKYPYA